jgi:hypothetical protein
MAGIKMIAVIIMNFFMSDSLNRIGSTTRKLPQKIRSGPGIPLLSGNSQKEFQHRI